MHLSVIIPAYNEARRIGKTLEAIGESLRNKSYDWEIIVVNNNSNDSTREIAEKYSGVRVIDEQMPGKGYAVVAGMAVATGEYRLFTDADNSTSIDHVERMWPLLNKGYDIVIGSLAVPGSRVVRGEPFYRVLFGKLGNKWIQIFAVWGINDTQRGFKMFTAVAAETIFPKLTIFGWGFDVEALALARKLGYKIHEVPIVWDNDPDSKVNIWAYPQVLLQTLKVRWNLITRIYGK